MKILILADIHSELHTLERILRDEKNKNIDVVVCPGNMTDMFKPQGDFSQLDIADIIIQKLLSLGKPVVCVPGNHDPYEILDVFNEYEVNIHNKHIKIKNINFIGFGGAQTPFNTLFEPTEEETKAALKKIKTKKPTVLVTHNPPKKTKMDKINSGEHVGSAAVRSFILERSPILSISAHIHEAFGEDILGKTKLFNPGPVFQGRYGIIEMNKNNIFCKNHKIKI